MDSGKELPSEPSSESSASEDDGIDEESYEGALAIDRSTVQPYQFELDASSESDIDGTIRLEGNQNSRRKNLDWYGIRNLAEVRFLSFSFL